VYAFAEAISISVIVAMAAASTMSALLLSTADAARAVTAKARTKGTIADLTRRMLTPEFFVALREE
jgi:hypothetical protein